MDNEQKNQHINARQKSQKMKKRIIIVFIASILALILVFVLVSILENVSKKLEEENEYKGRTYTIIYCDPIEDISKDEEYMALNRNIYYFDSTSGVTYIVDEETKSDYGDAVELLYNYVNDIIKGDFEAYNNYFSKYYYETKVNGKTREKKTYMHEQELYGIVITKEAEMSYPDGSDSYEQYEYSLTFRIHNNNGGFRLNVDHDAEKKEYYIITTKSGKLKIDNIIEYQYR